jgi:hypothetical protein
VHYGRRHKPYFKLPNKERPAAAAAHSWNVPDLCVAYSWPTPDSVPGGGVIAIVELGGGWVQSDMDQFFGSIGQPVPQITDVSFTSSRPPASEGNI